MKQTLTVNAKLKKLFKDTSFECYQYEDFETSYELIESLKNEISEDEVIYYSKAMEYLRMKLKQYLMKGVIK